MHHKSSSILILLFSLFSHAYSQDIYNFKFGQCHDVLSSYELLYEDSSSYYAIGYFDDDTPGLGIRLSTHNKNSGALVDSTYFGIRNKIIYTGGRTPVYSVNHDLVFGIEGNTYILKLLYDRETKKIIKLDSIENPTTGAYYLNDMIIRNDTTIYNALRLEDTTNINTIIYSYPDGRKKFIYMPNKVGYYNTGGRILQKENGNLILFGSSASLTNSGDEFITVTEIDTSGTIIQEYTSPLNYKVWLTDDILLKNSNEAFILARGDSYDAILKKRASTHWLYKFDLSTYKVIWRKNYGEPASNYFGGGGEVCKGHRDSEYLYCTTLWGKGASLDSLYLVGRVVKVREDGSKVWQKDYSHLPNLNTNSNLYTMIPVDSSHYLLGGRTNTGTTICSWLVKIDEGGNIVPIDTTSTISITDIPNITIYPNPATDQIIINQGEQSDMMYSIYDAQGRIALSQSVSEPHQNMIWDISNLSSGLYVLSISHKGQIIKSVQLVVH